MKQLSVTDIESEDVGVAETIQTDKCMLKTDSDGNIIESYISDLQQTSLGMIILHRLIHNRDIKIVITSAGNTTGTGKSTLAVLLSRIIKRYSSELFNSDTTWDIQKSAFTDGWEFVEKYKSSDQGDVLITDELEIMADSRRSMTNRNLELTQRLQTMRYKNVVTVGTLPGLWSVDKRVRENFDIWINVQSQGLAYIYYITMNDFTGEHIVKRLRMYNRPESLCWLPIDHDEDKKYIDSLKETAHTRNNNSEENEQESMRENMINIKKDFALELLILNDLHDLGLSQGDIAEMIPSEEEGKDHMSQQWISHVKREAKKEGLYESMKQALEGRV